jgi:hypothetical protein
MFQAVNPMKNSRRPRGGPKSRRAGWQLAACQKKQGRSLAYS